MGGCTTQTHPDSSTPQRDGPCTPKLIVTGGSGSQSCSRGTYIGPDQKEGGSSLPLMTRDPGSVSTEETRSTPLPLNSSESYGSGAGVSVVLGNGSNPPSWTRHSLLRGATGPREPTPGFREEKYRRRERSLVSEVVVNNSRVTYGP